MPADRTSLFSPFSIALFRRMWTAMLCVNFAAFMQEVGAGWLMATLEPTPLMVSLAQAAVTLPVFILAIPAGAIADLTDRRRYLLVLFLAVGACVFALGALTFAGWVTGWVLLAFTFAYGIGVALMMPALSAVIPELVDREMLQSAVVLNSVTANIGRAAGPAVAGLIIASLGPSFVFMANAAAYVYSLAMFFIWKRNVRESRLPKETVLQAMRSGLRFAAYSEGIRAVIVRGILFFTFASAIWALLPLIVKEQLMSGPKVYGVMLGCVGTGALFGAYSMSKLLRVISRDTLIRFASFGFAVSMLIVSCCSSVLPACVTMLFGGFCWIQTASTLIHATQLHLPAWVRARGLAFFWLTLFGGLAIGSMFWGWVAEYTGIRISLASGAVCVIAGIAVGWKFSVSRHDADDLTLVSPDWAGPEPTGVSLSDGPVRITVEYHPEDRDREAFLSLVNEFGQVRLKNGATDWHVAERDGVFTETYRVETVLDMLRQRERLTVADAALRSKIRSMSVKVPPKTVRFVGPETENRSF